MPPVSTSESMRLAPSEAATKTSPVRVAAAPPVSRWKFCQEAELRGRILKAARGIVVDEGFGSLTIRKLAEAIEYAPGTIYLYFKNREEIARQLCIQGYQEMLGLMEPAAAVADPLKRLAALLEAYARFGMGQPETYRLIFMADPKLAQAVFESAPIDAPETGGLRAFGFIVSALDELKKQRRLTKSADTTRLAEVLWASIHGVVSLKLTSPSYPATPTDTLVSTTVRTLFEGLPGLRR